MATIANGQSVQVPGKQHVMKNAHGTYSCSCPAWRNQGRGVNRTCKHLVDYLGDQSELARVGYDAMPTAWQKTHPQVAVNQNATPVAAVVAPVVSIPANGTKKRSTSRAAVAASEAPVLLAEKWTPDIDPTGMWMSEKLDGVRAYWDGTRFISRQGNEFWAPPEFIADMPNEVLDGELYLGRGRFTETLSIVRTQNRDTYDRWKNLTFRTFDAPEHSGHFEERLEHCKRLCAKIQHAEVVPHDLCESMAHLRDELERIESLKGEGLMLRIPKSPYTAGKSFNLLKVKNFFDSECKIVGYTAGKGQHKGKVGAFECEQMRDDTVCVGGKTVTVKAGTKFKVGSGLTHALRASPPAIGTTVTYRFVELTDDDVPRHGTFVAVRDYE